MAQVMQTSRPVVRTKTQLSQSIIPADTAQTIFEYLRDNTEWKESVRSRRHGFTRYGSAIDPNKDEMISNLIEVILPKINAPPCLILGAYLNYYVNGEHFSPNHSHPGLIQVVISLGATRTLTVGKRAYSMSNGDVIIFGSSNHGVPKEPHVENGRISIALFLQRI